MSNSKMLSVEQKCNICLISERHPKWTQLELARWAYETFQLPSVPSQGTISRVLAKKSIFMSSKGHEKDANRIRRPNNPLVRRILQEWISQSVWNGIPITSPIIQDTAQSMWHRIPAEHREGNGSFSYKWISNFLSKMDVNVSVLDEEQPKTPKVWTFEERDTLKQFFVRIPPKNLFTLDETFLAYNLPLDYAQYETSHIQRKIEVATVMLCANLDGSEKMKPLVVGRYNNYNSFRNYFPLETAEGHSRASLGEKMAEKFEISYHSNRKAWLTSNLFHNWLARWDKRLVAYDRKIWIILDDSCSHRLVNLHLQNINLVYTSANSRFLPFNWGVLEEFKTRYRIQQYRALIELQQRLEQSTGRRTLISFEQSKLTMSNAFKFIKQAWDDIPVDAIKANWKSSGLLPPEYVQLNENVSMAFKKNEVLEAELNTLCEMYHCVKKWEYDLLLDLNIENKNNNFLSAEELVESAIVDEFEPMDDTIVNYNDNLEDLNYGVLSNNSSVVPIQTDTIPATTHVSSAISKATDTHKRHSTPILNSANLNSVAGLVNTNNVPNEIDGMYDDFHNILGGASGGGRSHENLFNVSLLIDKPNSFFNEIGDLDINAQGVEYNIPSPSYFNDLLDPSVNPNNAEKESKVPAELTSNLMIDSNASLNETEVKATRTSNYSLGGNATPRSANVITELINDEKTITSSTDPNPVSSLSSSAANVDHPHNLFPETKTLSGAQHHSSFFKNTSQVIANCPDLSAGSDASGAESILEATYMNKIQNNLRVEIDIAKSLSNIIKHSEARKVKLSNSTLRELNSCYDKIQNKIKKTRIDMTEKNSSFQGNFEKFLMSCSETEIRAPSESLPQVNFSNAATLNLPRNSSLF